MNERRVASSTIELPCYEAVESHTSTQIPFVPLCRACSWERDREVPQPFDLGGAVSVTVTTPIESLGKFVPTFERQHLTVVPSDSNTMSNLGLASILTERCEGTRRLERIPSQVSSSFEHDF